MPLWAVHISDFVLLPGWIIGGWVGALGLAALGCWRIREEEIPHIALMTAAFFVASSMHIPLGPVRAHLLLNGLLGVVLGRRAGLAILIGLFMQAALIGHGGYTTLGVTCCVMTVPALICGQLFSILSRLAWHDWPWLRAGLVALSVMIWLLALIYGVAWLSGNGVAAVDAAGMSLPNRIAFHPAILAGVALAGGLAAYGERRMENAPEFALGLLLGELSVLLTVILNCTVLFLGGEAEEVSRLVGLVQLVAHLPIAAVEGIILGFAVGFLVRVKPEMLGITTKD